MPRMKDYSANQPDPAIDDYELLWDLSTDTQAVKLPGRVPALLFASFPANSDSHVGWVLFATDGRKSGEGAAAGTGILAVFDGTDWIGVLSEVAVTT